jgi:hypothetical protein
MADIDNYSSLLLASLQSFVEQASLHFCADIWAAIQYVKF